MICMSNRIIKLIDDDGDDGLQSALASRLTNSLPFPDPTELTVRAAHRTCRRVSEDLLCLSAITWDQLLRLAEQVGWMPQLPAALYRSQLGAEMTEQDAGRLAEALETADSAYHLYQDAKAQCTDHDEFEEALLEVMHFSRNGAFRVVSETHNVGHGPDTWNMSH